MLEALKPHEPTRLPGQIASSRVIEVQAKAGPARIRRRHWGLMLSFLVLVVAPLVAIFVYLTEYAAPQFASTAGFTVRQNEPTGPSELLGGITQLAAGPATVDGDILYEFIESQALVQRLQARMDLTAHYSAPHETDPIFALPPDTSIEDFVDHWQRVVRTSYNQSNGLIELRVLAFSPEMAQALGEAILEEGQVLVNALNATVREDTMRYSQADLDLASDRLREAREALTAFRTRTQIVDPESDLQGRLGVLNNLQQQLAEVLIEYDLLLENTTNADDPRVRQTGQRIDVIRARIAEERENFNTFDYGSGEEDYPSLMTEYEGLLVERELAEQAYGLAVAALDLARTNAARQSRYLAVFIAPTFPETAEFPRVDVIMGQAVLFLLIGWSILALVYYSIRDRQ